MKTEYNFIKFEKIKGAPKNHNCISKGGGSLGTIRYYKPWRQYCFFSSLKHSIVLSADCMEDINHFIGQLKTGGP